MIIKTLYRVMRSDGGIDITPNKPVNKDYSKTYRLISETGMALTDGNSIFICIDTDNIDKYHEIEYEKSIEDEYES